jgi:hypothetical protein
MVMLGELARDSPLERAPVDHFGTAGGRIKTSEIVGHAEVELEFTFLEGEGLFREKRPGRQRHVSHAGRAPGRSDESVRAERLQARPDAILVVDRGREPAHFAPPLDGRRRCKPARKTTRATWEVETAKQRKLERQIATCKIVAPMDGTLVHGRTPSVIRNDGSE